MVSTEDLWCILKYLQLNLKKITNSGQYLED